MNINKTILITGSSKNLGDYLTKHYLKKNFNVIGVTKKSFSDTNKENYKCDLSSANKTYILFKKIKKKIQKYRSYNSMCWCEQKNLQS